MTSPNEESSLDRVVGAGPTDDGSTPSPLEGAFSVFSENQKTVISKPASAPQSMPQAINPSEVAQALEGENLDHFALQEFVGGGGMGAVFRAVDTQLGRTVAVKVLSRHDTDEEMRLRFRNEAQSAARLDHPNIARVYYVGEDNGWYFIVFEYIEGVNIRDLVEHKGPLPLEEALTFTRHVAEALQHASERDVVHRDIKPSNVLVTPDGNAKLVDMGLARLHQIESSGADLTASGVTLGTFDYISPEQARDPRGTDVRSDLYSLGCTLYFMLTGSPPFPEGTVLQKLLSHSSEPPPDPRTYRPELDERVVAVVDRLLAKQPANRYQTPAELVTQLVILGEQLGLPRVTEGQTVYLRSKTQRPRFLERHANWILPLALLLIAVVVVERTSRSNSPQRISPPRLDSPPLLQKTMVTPSKKADDQGKKAGASQAPAGKNEKRDGPASAGKKNAVDDVARQPENVAKGTTGAPDSDLVVQSPPLPDENPSAIREDILVVAPEGFPVPGEYRVERTLVDALQRSQLANEVTTIEIWTNEVLTVPRIDLDMRGRSGIPLTIRSGTGFRPILSFELTEDYLISTNRISCSRLRGGVIAWEDLHFYLQLPRRVRQSWAMFYLEEVERWDMTRCSLTIRNVGEDGVSTGTERVAFLELAPPRMDDGRRDEADNREMVPVTGLSFENCVVRGQATWLRAEQAVPADIQWNNGLFISTERLLEFRGRRTKPRFEDGTIKLELSHVTAFARRGIALLHSDDTFRHQLDFSAQCQNCIFVVGESAPLYEQRSMVPAGMTNRPNVHGSSNYYQNTDIVLRTDLGGPDEMSDFSFMDLRDRQQRNDDDVRWYNEREFNSGRMLQWRPNAVPPTQSSVDLQRPEDFMLKKYDREGASNAAGFVPWELPQPPAIQLDGLEGEPKAFGQSPAAPSSSIEKPEHGARTDMPGAPSPAPSEKAADRDTGSG